MLKVDDDNTTGTENGSVQNPYNTIQEAIDAANSGETVAVAAGTYGENILVQDKTVHLFGGYVGGSSADYATGSGGNFSARDPNANTTHIRGDSTDSVVNLIRPGASILNGFRITGGTRSIFEDDSDNGGGIYCLGDSATISNNIIENNDSHPPTPSGLEANGGGIYAEEPWDRKMKISIIDNIIRNNISGQGAGINIQGGAAIIRDNTIQGNKGMGGHGGGMLISSPFAEISRNRILKNEIGLGLGYGWGGGITVLGTDALKDSVTLSYNVITGNYAPSPGSGVFIDEGAEAVLDHELIYGNQCPDGAEGGVGVYVDGALEGNPGDPGSKATLIHCTIANNPCETSRGGNGLLIEGNSNVTVKNCIFWGNGGDDFFTEALCTLTVAYTNSEESITGVGNISGDPLFADPDNNDYHLQSTTGRWDPTANGGSGGWVNDSNDSPCIDAGDPTSDYSSEPAGSNGGQANMGAYGNTAEASKSIVTGVTDAPSQLPQRFVLHQNYPNPFNPTTLIQYDLPKHQKVKISIYNTQGRQVRLLEPGHQNAGSHTAQWDGRNQAGKPAASGVYVYQVQAGKLVQARKMILLR